LGGLDSLRTLILRSNGLTGPIPSELGGLANLTGLVLSQNQLTVTIPAELGNLANLAEFNISINQLTGTIPPELGNLGYLFVYQNLLDGPLPETLTDLNLISFRFDNTGIYEPAAAAFQAWLDGIASLQRTGVLCRNIITVNATIDGVDANPGDTVCQTVNAGECTLRAAIMEANALAGPDDVVVPAGTYVLTIAGQGEDAAVTGDLDITGDLSIMGAGPATTIVDGGALDTVFHILSGNTVEISGVTIRNGSGSGLGGGGISNSGNTNTGGGGIRTIGKDTVLTLIDSTVSDNSTGASGGGIFSIGGLVNGIRVGSFVTLNNSTVSGNTITGNAGCGGIANLAGTLTLTNSTVSGNTTAAQGGGIYNWVEGTTTLTNSTISGNTAATHGGGIVIESGTVTFKNTIVAGNHHGGSVVPNDCTGTLTSQGHNLIEAVSSCTIIGDTTGNITGQDALLGPLQDNGGAPVPWGQVATSGLLKQPGPRRCGTGGLPSGHHLPRAEHGYRDHPWRRQSPSAGRGRRDPGEYPQSRYPKLRCWGGGTLRRPADFNRPPGYRPTPTDQLCGPAGHRPGNAPGRLPGNFLSGGVPHIDCGVGHRRLGIGAQRSQ